MERDRPTYTKDMKQSKATTLVFCVLSLYASFLSWSLLQERINTKPYALDENTAVYFKAPLVVNTVQALFAAIVGLCYSVFYYGENPLGIFEQDPANPNTTSLVRSFLIISITSSVSSPLGYLSLKHVDYLAFLLAKSCKLLPVMLVHFVLYRTRFPPYKYVVAGLVTGGVVFFTLAKSEGKYRDSINDGNTLLGMTQLLGSMLLDGFTNSTQDQLFKSNSSKQKLTGASLMFVLNMFVFVLTLGYTLFFAYEKEAVYTMRFIEMYPRALYDIVAFALFGAVGQVFVFLILEKFDSLILVTATVTRKMISMMLSVLLFGHRLVFIQWFGVLMVFGGIGYESYVKMALSKPKTE